ncbi:GNAT family protein [Xanthomonadaceae bacterium JHOS43]|nr:GNAT family protein [Xanthomonadaceae bacterium JHOS43]
MLVGRHVRLEPLRRDHEAAMSAARDDAGLDGAWFTNLPVRDVCGAYIDAAIAQHDRGESLPFAVVDAVGTVVGSTRLNGREPDVPSALIGRTWHAPRVQRTGLDTEAKLLLLAHAFEVMGFVCVGFETGVHDVQSRAVILRSGTRQEGTPRKHKRHADGSLRDRVILSIIDGEWPLVKRSLQDRLQRREAEQ